MSVVSQLAPSARDFDACVVAVVGPDEPYGAAIRKMLAARGAQLCEQVEDATGGLDAVVFIAGPDVAGDLAATAASDYAANLSSGLKPAFLALRAGVAAMRSGGRGGAVVFVAPPARHRGHGAVQSGLRLMAKAAALELGPEGIRVNTVLPGAASDDAPLGRGWSADDIAEAVAFAASERARFMTGADLLIDGGRVVA
jgi:NAD(P)-dependent dehydrogenase (short-subunit alcohol dehydrogenase family)